MIVNGKETTDMITTIMMVPVVSNEESENHGVLVVACNPHLPLNDAYKVHIELVSRQVANAINTAKSFEAERSRAEVAQEEENYVLLKIKFKNKNIKTY